MSDTNDEALRQACEARVSALFTKLFNREPRLVDDLQIRMIATAFYHEQAVGVRSVATNIIPQSLAGIAYSHRWFTYQPLLDKCETYARELEAQL